MDSGPINFSINSYITYSNYRELIYSDELKNVIFSFIDRNRLIDKNKFRCIFNRFFGDEELSQEDFEDLKVFFGYKDAIEDIYSNILNDYYKSSNTEAHIGYGSDKHDFYHDEVTREFLYSLNEEIKYRKLKQEINKIKSGVSKNIDLISIIFESNHYEVLNIRGNIYIYNKREKIFVPDEFTFYDVIKRKEYGHKNYIFITAKNDFLVNIQNINGLVILYSLKESREILRGKNLDIRLDGERTIIKYEENGEVKYFYVEGRKDIDPEEGFDIFLVY